MSRPIIEAVAKKLTSGRWLLTVISGMVFAYAVMSNKISAEAVSSILTAVFVSYFNRKETNGGTDIPHNDSQ